MQLLGCLYAATDEPPSERPSIIKKLKKKLTFSRSQERMQNVRESVASRTFSLNPNTFGYRSDSPSSIFHKHDGSSYNGGVPEMDMLYDEEDDELQMFEFDCKASASSVVSTGGDRYYVHGRPREEFDSPRGSLSGADDVKKTT